PQPVQTVSANTATTQKSRRSMGLMVRGTGVAFIGRRSHEPTRAEPGFVATELQVVSSLRGIRRHRDLCFREVRVVTKRGIQAEGVARSVLAKDRGIDSVLSERTETRRRVIEEGIGV